MEAGSNSATASSSGEASSSSAPTRPSFQPNTAQPQTGGRASGSQAPEGGSAETGSDESAVPESESAEAPWGPTTRRVEQLLERARSGDEEANSELLNTVYPQLHQIADRLFRAQDPSHTLQATALVHEAFLKYVNSGARNVRNAEHLYRLMAKAMRQVMMDYARSKQRLKRPQRNDRVHCDMSLLLIEEFEERAGDVESLTIALDSLAIKHPHLAEHIELHFFAARTHREIAELKNISERESQRRVTLAKGFIKREIDRLST